MNMLKNSKRIVSVVLTSIMCLSSIAYGQQLRKRERTEHSNPDNAPATKIIAADQMQFLNLPVEVTERVLHYLSPIDIVNLRNTNKALRAIVDEYSSQLPSLSFASLSYEERDALTSEQLKKILSYFPNLEEIEISRCTQVTDALIQWIAKKYPLLIGFNLAFVQSDRIGCPKVTEVGIKALAEGCPQLTHLCLSGCWKVADAGLQALAEKCLYLTHLDLSSCLQIVDATLQLLAKGFSQLTSLDLSWCDQITDLGLQALVAAFPQLSIINLSDCNQVTDKGVQALVAGFPHLKLLDVRHCAGVTDAMVQVLCEQCPRLKIIH